MKEIVLPIISVIYFLFVLAFFVVETLIIKKGSLLLIMVLLPFIAYVFTYFKNKKDLQKYRKLRMAFYVETIYAMLISLIYDYVLHPYSDGILFTISVFLFVAILKIGIYYCMKLFRIIKYKTEKRELGKQAMKISPVIVSFTYVAGRYFARNNEKIWALFSEFQKSLIYWGLMVITVIMLQCMSFSFYLDYSQQK